MMRLANIWYKEDGMHFVVMSIASAVFCIAGYRSGIAQQDACRHPRTRQVDPQATANWQQVSARADPTSMQRLVGVWNQEIPSPATNQVAYTQFNFEPNGLFQFRQRVCGSGGNMCSDFQGFGQFAVMSQAPGTFYGLMMTSDMTRDHVCSTFAGRFADDYTILTADGANLQRAR